MKYRTVRKCLSCILAATIFWGGVVPTNAEEAVLLAEDTELLIEDELTGESIQDNSEYTSQDNSENRLEQIEQDNSQNIIEQIEQDISREDSEKNAQNSDLPSESDAIQIIEIEESTDVDLAEGEPEIALTSLLEEELAEWEALEEAVPLSEMETSGTCGTNATWEFDPESGLLTISGSGAVTKSEDDSTWHGLIKGNVKKIKIDAGITEIGEYAFYAFRNLEEIEIPEGVENIGAYAFSYCASLEQITVPEGVTSIEQHSFEYCTALEQIILQKGLKSISAYVFSNCSSLKSIELPEGVTSIREYAFSNCSSLESIELPEGVTSIREYAFSNCSSLESIELPEGATNICEYAFSNCSALESIELPEGVTNISAYAFSNCSALESIELPEGITSISEYTFFGCSSLKSIELSEGITSIQKYAFLNCSALESIRLPEGVTSIESSAFSGCESLLSVKFCSRTNSLSINSTAFDFFYLKTIYGYAGTTVENYAEGNCKFVDLTLVEAAIERLPALDDLVLANITLIKDAKAEYDKIEVSDYVDLKLREKLFAADEKMTVLETEDFIFSCLDQSNLMTVYRKAVETARVAYDQLTDSQKEMFDKDLYNRLLAAVAELDAITMVTEDLKRLAESSELTIADRTSIDTIKAAYSALSEEQKKKIEEELVQKLYAAVARMEELTVIEAVKAVISALPQSEQLTLKDKAAVEQARAAYEALTNTQQAELDSALATRLTEAEYRLAVLREVESVERAIAALLELPNLTTTNWEIVEKANNIYQAMTEEQRSFFDAKLLAALKKLQAEIAEQKAVEEVKDSAAQLPQLSELSVSDQASVAAVRAAYEALSAEQKQQMDSAFLKWLLAAEARMAELEKAAEHVHSWGSETVTKAATCAAAGIRIYQCSCGATKTETIAISAQHTYGSWQTAAEATVSAAQTQKRSCSICGAEETQSVGAKLTQVLELPGKLSAFNMKKGSTSTFTVTMANGDSTASVKSNKTAILKATLAKKTGKITLKAVKTGTAKLTIKLASGKSRTYTVKVENGTIKTTAVTVTSVTNKKLTLAQGKTHTLKTELKPFTSTQKLTYTSSNKKIATVTSAGKIKAVAAGKATITVKSGSKSVKITVTVPGITNVKSSVTVKKGKTLTLSPKTYGISEKVTYASSDTKIATVTSKGKIKGIKKGTAKITITAGSYKQTVTVKVN